MTIAGKIHLKNTTAKTEDYPNSPHVSSAIRNGEFTECRIIQFGLRITNDPNKTTCIACLRIWAEQQGEKHA